MKKLAIALMVLFSIISIIAQIPNVGLTHAYLMNGDGKDASGNGFDLFEIYPKDTTDRNGSAHKAMALDLGKHSCFRLSDTSLPSAGESFSVSLWVNNNSITYGNPTIISWGKYDAGSYFSMSYQSGGTHINITNGIDTITTRIIQPYDIHLAWVPITITYENATLKVFFGDSLVTTAAFTLNIITGGYLGIGGQFTAEFNYVYYLEGMMDQILIYDRVLTQQEISNLLTCEERVNQAPIFTSTAPTEATVGELYTYTLTGSDPDGDEISFHLITETAGMILTNNQFKWTPTDTGSYMFNILVTDGMANTEQISIVTASEPIFVNTPPVFTSHPETITKVNEQYNYFLEAEDHDNQELTYMVIQCPEDAIMNFTGNKLTWRPTEMGDYEMEVAVTDKIDTTFQKFTVTVEPTTSVIRALHPAQYRMFSKKHILYTINGRKIVGNKKFSGILLKKGKKFLTVR